MSNDLLMSIIQVVKLLSSVPCRPIVVVHVLYNISTPYAIKGNREMKSRIKNMSHPR